MMISKWFSDILDLSLKFFLEAILHCSIVAYIFFLVVFCPVYTLFETKN